MHVSPKQRIDVRMTTLAAAPVPSTPDAARRGKRRPPRPGQPVTYRRLPDHLRRRTSPRAWGRVSAVWCALAEHDLRGDGAVWPSVARLVQLTGLSRRTVHEALRDLRDMDAIEVHRTGRASLYRLRYDPAEATGDVTSRTSDVQPAAHRTRPSPLIRSERDQENDPDPDRSEPGSGNDRAARDVTSRDTETPATPPLRPGQAPDRGPGLERARTTWATAVERLRRARTIDGVQWFPGAQSRERLERAYAIAGDGAANLTIAVPSEPERRWIDDRRVEITGIVESVTGQPIQRFDVVVGAPDWWEFPAASDGR